MHMLMMIFVAMRMHPLTPTHTSTYVNVAQAEAASPRAMHELIQTSQCFAVDQPVPRWRQDTTTLRLSTGSDHGQQRNRDGHPAQRLALCAHAAGQPTPLLTSREAL
jgi:hypothetical protein